MTLPRETISTGAEPRCSDCGLMPALGVYRSAAGFYIGSYCHCGPYTRASRYFATRTQAEQAFQQGGYQGQ